jgi:hypothetical protein
MTSDTNIPEPLPSDESDDTLSIATGYIQHKASLFLKLGVAKYRKMDALGAPHNGISRTELTAIKTICKKLVEDFGFSKQQCLFGISMRACYSAMSMFHFEETHRSSTYNFNHGTDNGVLDILTFEHVVINAKVTLYVFYTLPDVVFTC